MPNYQSMETQQAFMRQELDGSENKAYRALQSAQSPEEAARAWDALYERSDGSTRNKREASARSLMDQFGGGMPDTGALSFASTGNNKSMPSPALSADDALGTGALNQIEKPDNVYDGLMQMASSLAGISNPEQAKALTSQMLAGRKAQGTWSHQILPNGQIMVSNSQGGMKVIGKPGDYSKDDTFQAINSIDPNTGLPLSRIYNKNTGQWADGGQNGAASNPASALPDSFDEFKQLNPTVANRVEAVEQGLQDFPKGGKLKPQDQMVVNALAKYKPDVDANVFNTRRQFKKDDAMSSPQSFGGGLQRTNTAMGLMDDVLNSYGKIGNTRSSLGAGAATVENYLSSGGDTQANYRRDLETKAQNAAADINALQTNGKGGQAEREHIKEGLYLPYASPREQAGAIQGHLDTLRAAVDAKFEHEARQMGKDFVEKDPRYQEYKQRLTAMQQKVDQLYNADFSYAKGGKSAAPAGTPALPKGVKSIQVIPQ
jgi:hypothetical protein